MPSAFTSDRRRSAATLAAAILLSWTGLACAQPAPRFTMQVMEPELLDAAHDVRVKAIDKQGHMIGSIEVPPIFTGGWYRWDAGGSGDGEALELKQGLGFYWDSAAAINEAGMIAFSAPAGRSQFRLSAAVAKPSGRMRVIQPRGASKGSQAMGLNESGTVVGWTELRRSGNTKTFGFVWSEEGGWREYDGPGDDKSRIRFTGINDAGIVIGENSDFPTRAFTFTESAGFRRIPGAWTAAAINVGGQIVGRGASGAYLHGVTEDTMWLPGLPGGDAKDCAAHDINVRGLIVGSCGMPDGTTRGVLWRPRAGVYTVAELDALVDGARPAGHWIDVGFRINDAGAIVVRLREPGQPWNVEHSALLRPL